MGVSARSVQNAAKVLADGTPELVEAVTGGEVALITLLEVVLGPLFIYFRFGEIPSGWTVAGGALLLGTLAAHEACGLHSAAAETMRSPMRRAAPSPASPNEESSPIPYQPAEVYGL